MEPFKVVEDTKVEYRFISNYYDVPLNGICYYLGILYEFERAPLEEYFDDCLHLYKLTAWQEFKWKLKQKLFEICVGYHWSWYPKNRGNLFHFRKPEWFYKKLFKLYYKFKWW